MKSKCLEMRDLNSTLRQEFYVVIWTCSLGNPKGYLTKYTTRQCFSSSIKVQKVLTIDSKHEVF